MTKNFNAWPEGRPRNLIYPEIPVYAFLDQTAARIPNLIAIIFEGMELTYGELKELCDRFATALFELGVQKGDRVAIHLPNCPQFAIAYYGLLKIGGVFTPLSPLLTPGEAAFQLADSGAEILVTLDLLYHTIRDDLPKTNIKKVITTSIADCQSVITATLKPGRKSEVSGTIDLVSLLQKTEADLPEIPLDVKEDLAHLAYTGGTTGVSKGVMITHQNVVANVIHHLTWFSAAEVKMLNGIITFIEPSGVKLNQDKLLLIDREVTLVCAPWFHAAGIIGFLNFQICLGARMVVFPLFDPKEYIEGVKKYGATLVGGAPQLYFPLINLPDFESYDLSGIKLASSGAAPLPVPVLKKLLNAFSGTVCEVYGLTEVTVAATFNPPYRDQIRIGSVGIPVFDTECKIVDPVTGEDLPPGSEGEICIRGPQVMKGYWDKPEETAEVLKEGWLYTGDIGREDYDGYFYITDRKKDMIIYKGYNVYPKEIEDVIFQHPAILQAAVVGRANPEVGEIPVAFVELRKGATASEYEILNFINSKIAGYKKVRELVFMENMPVSAAGKVLKKELRKQFE